MIDGSEPVASEFAALWPIQRFPVIVDDGQFVFEATGIIEYLEARFPETARLIPADALAAAKVRMWDRFFDNYVSYPQGRLVFMAIGREPDDGKGGAAWKSMLETSYALLDRRMADRTWAAGESFSLADCAATPALLYADWTHPIPERFAAVHAYRWRASRSPKLRPRVGRGASLPETFSARRTCRSGLKGTISWVAAYYDIVRNERSKNFDGPPFGL